MGRKLAKTVNVRNENGEVTRLFAGEEPTPEQAEQITNPAAWAAESAEDRQDGGAWPPDGGFSAMDDEEIFRAANATSTSTGEEGDDSADLRTAKATGDHDPSETYRSATIPQLRALADERGLEHQGLTRKQELIDLLNEADRSDAS